MAYSLLVSPFQSPDEANHFLRAYQVSEGHFLPEKTQDMRLGGHLPTSLLDFQAEFMYMKNTYSAHCSLPQIKAASSQDLAPNNKVFIDFANTAIYAPTAYIPQSFALYIGRKIEFAPIFLLYAARLANLFCWLLLVSATLRLLPYGHRIVAYIALLPATLVIAASCNADVISNGLAFWSIAFFLKKEKQNRSPLQLSILLALTVLSLNKIVYAPIALLGCLGFFKKNRRTKRHILHAALLITIPITAALLWAKASNHYFIPYDAYSPTHRIHQTLNEGVEPQAQLDFIIQKPFLFLKTACVSYLDALPSTAAHIVGKFGWEKNYLAAPLLALLWLGLFVLLFSEKNPVSVRQRLWVFGITLCCLMCFSITMYCLWMPVGHPMLSNLQGRYFVPLLPLLSLVFMQKTKLNSYKKWIWPFIIGILALGNSAMCLALLHRYWL